MMLDTVSRKQASDQNIKIIAGKKLTFETYGQKKNISQHVTQLEKLSAVVNHKLFQYVVLTIKSK